MRRMMDFKQYQEIAHTTAQYPGDKAMTYLSLGLAGEAGELCGKIAKYYRGDANAFHVDDLAHEIGDVLWFCAELATFFNLDLDEIALKNAMKLKDRAERNMIKGNGDYR